MFFLGKRILSALGDKNGYVTPRGGPVRLFGLPWGFTSNQEKSPQKIFFEVAHPLPPKNRPSKSQKIDIFEKNFEKILKVQKFLWSRSGRNFCWQGRTPEGHNSSYFQYWNIPSKTRKVMIIQSCAAFGQKPPFWTSWQLLTLIGLSYHIMLGYHSLSGYHLLFWIFENRAWIPPSFRQKL